VAPDEPQQLAAKPTARRSRRRRLLIVGVVLLLMVAAAAAALAIFWPFGSDGDSTTVRADDAAATFTIHYPKTWHELPKDKLSGYKPTPITAIQRDGAVATILVTAAKTTSEKPATLAAELDQKLKGQLKDYKRVAASIIKLPAGDAFFFAYLRIKQGTLNTLTVLPLGNRSYVFSTVFPSRSKQIASEVVKIMRSIRRVSA
jgi:hypothetical protein